MSRDARRKRLKALFEGRRRQLEAAKMQHWPYTPEESRRYSAALVRYTRARSAWRAFRGLA